MFFFEHVFKTRCDVAFPTFSTQPTMIQMHLLRTAVLDLTGQREFN